MAGLLYMGHNNNYLHFAPNYESTVAHTRFDNLMEATYKMEDISTMERLHRWVSGFNMILERPWTGFGPNNFYFSYKPYSNYSFKTYVSNNPDKSGLHNYYLMMAVEQGIIGFLVFCSLLILAIFTGERAYHRCKRHKDIIMMSLLMVIGIMVMILINDLVEAVKVGSFMFVALGIISFYSKSAKSTELVH
jgi:O-antigen ligase